MSTQPAAPSSAQSQGVEFVNDFMKHSDFRLIASFFLGCVFLSSLRHIWMSAFVREFVRIFKATFSRLRGKAEPVIPMSLLHEKSTGAYQPSSVRTADLYRLKQQDIFVLLLCLAFLLASLFSFLSLLDFNPNGSGAACAFVVALSAIASQASRVFGLLILGLTLRHRVSRLWEVRTFWLFLGLVTVLNVVTVGLGPGQLVTPLVLPGTSLCFRKRFLPTSLAGSILNIVLELYILIRILSLVKPPRLQCATIQDTLVLQAGSLLLFDLLVIVPEAILTGLVAEFIPFSMGALTVLVAFHSPFGQRTLHPSRRDDPDLTSRPPMAPPGPPIVQHDTPNRLIHVENHPPSAIALAIHDIEAAAATSLSPRAAPQSSSLLNEVLWETNPVAPPQPVEMSVQTTIAYDVSVVTQVDIRDLPRKQRIMSYSSPIWETFGARQQNKAGAPSRPIEFARSPLSSHPPEQDDMAHPSPSSTILGSDIIRVTSSHHGKDRMRIRHSAPSSALSPTSSIPSPSPWATHLSWASMVSAHPPDNAPHLNPMLTRETTQSMSSRSSKSRRGSKPSRSFRSAKSSIRSAKVAVVPTGERNLPRSTVTVFRAPVVSSRLSRGFPVKTRHTRPAGVVRGPRPSPSTSRTMGEKL